MNSKLRLNPILGQVYHEIKIDKKLYLYIKCRKCLKFEKIKKSYVFFIVFPVGQFVLVMFAVECLLIGKVHHESQNFSNGILFKFDPLVLKSH